MKTRILLPLAATAALALAAMPAEAAGGRHRALGVGLAAGVAAGAIGAAIISNNARAAAPVAPAPAPGYYPVAQYDAVPTCVVRPIELFDRNGTYVKTERMRICR